MCNTPGSLDSMPRPDQKKDILGLSLVLELDGTTRIHAKLLANIQMAVIHPVPTGVIILILHIKTSNQSTML